MEAGRDLGRGNANPATTPDGATAVMGAQPAPTPDDDWPVGRLVETIWAMDAEANGGVDALRRNRLADWIARARTVHRSGWTAAEPWSSGEQEAAAWILGDHDAMNQLDTTPAEIVTRLGYDIQASAAAKCGNFAPITSPPPQSPW